MARKDDPVFNVKFVQLVENQACLWNYTHPGYSKKEEVQKAWQHVANEIKDTVRNSRERWRTIRSSFLRSLKAARTSTGRGKRKYYLSKYLQFLIPYTKSRACHKQLPAQSSANAIAMPNPNPNQSPNNAGGMVLRKPSTSTTAATFLAAAALSTQPMTRIGHMRLLEHHHHHQHQEQQHQEQHHHSHQVNECDDNTKDSIDSQPAHVQVSEEELDQEQQEQHEDEPEQETVASQLAQTPLRLQSIKVEQQQNADKIVAAAAQHSLVTLPVTMAAALRNNMDWTVAEWLKGSNSQLQLQHLHHSSNNNNNNNNSNSNMLTHLGHAATTPPAASTPAPPAAAAAAATPTAAAQPDADYSFLISLHPYLKEMSGKQNRRFRQKVVGLIDNVLDNVDV
ncbi:T-box protein H15 [Drosophila novamexicana]|uniref:T-box protein H15 n=1 Tax=Drosophila novamexicana TaxID=47314 RepID=UPI0011E5C111|nr:T-box protein H15 [Drosophila novamexicana]